jgi:hypothetical protein
MLTRFNGLRVGDFVIADKAEFDSFDGDTWVITEFTTNPIGTVLAKVQHAYDPERSTVFYPRELSREGTLAPSAVWVAIHVVAKGQQDGKKVVRSGFLISETVTAREVAFIVNDSVNDTAAKRRTPYASALTVATLEVTPGQFRDLTRKLPDPSLPTISPVSG